MSLGGGYSQSESRQESQNYGPLGGGGNRTAVQHPIIDILTGAGFTGAPGGYGGGVFNQLYGRTQERVPYQLPTLNAMGLQPEQSAALQTPFQQAVQQALGSTSGNYAMRGFNRPENIQAIAGSAAQNVAPQFANLYAQLASQNLQQRTQAPLVQEDLQRQRFTDLLNALGLGGTLLGGQATSLGTSKSMGVQAQGSITGGGEKGTGTIFGA